MSKNCKHCDIIFIDRSNAQKAHCCSRKCQNAYYYKVNKDKCKAYSKTYKARPGRKEIEKEVNRLYYIENKDKINAISKIWTNKNRKRKNAIQAKRRAAQINATPSWLTKNQLEEIRQIYEQCPHGYHVDHIVPLKSDFVCGLHVPWNLQIIKAEDNLKKYNKYEEKEATDPKIIVASEEIGGTEQQT